MTWSCHQCGKCCQVVILPIPKCDNISDMKDWLRYHQHITVVNDFIILKSKCKHLGYKNGKHYCKIGERRPDICKRDDKDNCLRGKVINDEI